MKIGTFVRKEALIATPKEIKYVSDEIQNTFKFSTTEHVMTNIEPTSNYGTAELDDLEISDSIRHLLDK